MNRLADDLYLIAHDDRTGRARVAPVVAGLAAAAGLLGELVLSGHLRMLDGCVFPLAALPPEDWLGRAVLGMVADPRQEREVGAWLRFLAAEAVGDVRNRLVREGVLIARGSGRGVVGRLVRRGVEYVPVNANAAAWPGIRLARLLCSGEPVGVPDALLACLAGVTGLLGQVLWFPPDRSVGWEQAALLRATLPPELGLLVSIAEVAVGDGVLTPRSV